MWNGRIKAPCSKLKCVEKEEVVSTLEEYKLDVEKFWLAVLFIYDWDENQFVKCVDIKSHSYGLLLQDLLGRLGDDMSDVTIQIRKGRKNLVVPPMIMQDMIEALHAKLAELKRKGVDSLFAYRSEDFTADYPVLSYKMYFATERLQELFAALERCGRIGKPKRRKGGLVAYHKMLLCARIAHVFRHTGKHDLLYGAG